MIRSSSSISFLSVWFFDWKDSFILGVGLFPISSHPSLCKFFRISSGFSGHDIYAYAQPAARSATAQIASLPFFGTFVARSVRALVTAGLATGAFARAEILRVQRTADHAAFTISVIPRNGAIAMVFAHCHTAQWYIIELPMATWLATRTVSNTATQPITPVSAISQNDGTFPSLIIDLISILLSRSILTDQYTGTNTVFATSNMLSYTPPFSFLLAIAIDPILKSMDVAGISSASHLSHPGITAKNARSFDTSFASSIWRITASALLAIFIFLRARRGVQRIFLIFPDRNIFFCFARRSSVVSI